MGLLRPRDDKKVFTVFYTRSSEQSAITSDNVIQLLASEKVRIKSEFTVTDSEFVFICQQLQNGRPADTKWSRQLKKAFLALEQLVDHKLRKELEFGAMDKVWLAPAVNTDRKRTNYITSAFSSSGGGKSYAIQSLDDIPKVTLFGSVGGDDPSYDKLRDALRERFAWVDPREMTAEQFDYKTYAIGSALIFDDIDSISDSRVRKRMQRFRDSCFEVARHRSQLIFATAHLFHSYQATAKMRNSSRWMMLFPRSTPHVLDSILDRDYGWTRQRRQDLIRKCKADSRMTFVGRQHPAHILTEKRLMLL